MENGKIIKFGKDNFLMVNFSPEIGTLVKTMTTWKKNYETKWKLIKKKTSNGKDGRVLRIFKETMINSHFLS